MELLILLVVLAAIPLAVTLGVLIRRLAGEPQTLPVTAEWIDELSVERYRPMLRLLAENDTQYLRDREGYTQKQARAFRAARCEIIRGYLGWLETDFARIAMAIRILMVQSQYDRPDLAMLLVRQKLAFHFGIMMINMHLWVYRWGLTRVDPSMVMGAFDCLRGELCNLVPAPAKSRA